MNMESISNGLSDYVDNISSIGTELGPMAVKAMILLVIVLLLVKYLGKFVSKVLVMVGMPERRAAYSVTMLHILVLIVGALVVLNLVGFPGALLFRIVMIIIMITIASYIITKPYLPRLPFKKGDIVKQGESMGIVDAITVMHTRIRTFDGKMIYIPNHKVMNDPVTNSSARPNRRVIIDFFIPYHEDVEKAKEVVGTILKEDERILEKPAPRVVIAKFTPDYMEMQARFWVVRKHALVSRWDLNAKIKARFDEEGIAMAAPRLEITSHPGP
ncbi:MAG: mechanosensitive ion channel [Deltaproteobacteria bacterium]|nr:mechanosensitive ion channel [Deltaproteobacteria bacterium]